MKIQLINRTGHRMSRLFLAFWLKQLARELSKHGHRVAGHELTLVFLSPREVQALNQKFRGKNKATDVLSFAPVENGSLGELVLCPAVLRVQAKAHRLTMQFELGYMVVHGVLHLLGYDHEKGGARARKMMKIQDEVFERLCDQWSHR